MGIDGIVNVAKPAGWTSHDVVAKLRRVLGERRIGHAGTLDPMATGVLVVCVGQATRVVDYLMGSPKQYRATVQLGLTTSTDDITGESLAAADPNAIIRDDVERLLPRFLGRIRQRPPVFSALKIDGRPMYALARKGLAPEPEEREVDVYSLSLTDWQPPRFGLIVDCGRGTYIRSLARDIGTQLGVGGCLASLERTRVGRYLLSDSLTIDEISALVSSDGVFRVLRPIDEALADLPAVSVDAEGERRIASGSRWPALSSHASVTDEETRPVSGGEPASADSPPSSASRCRVYSIDRRLIAVADRDPDSGVLQPVITFRGLAATPDAQSATRE